MGKARPPVAGNPRLHRAILLEGAEFPYFAAEQAAVPMRSDTAFFVDQTELETVLALGRQLPAELDLVIDDGLHSPNANIAILTLAIMKLKKGRMGRHRGHQLVGIANLAGCSVYDAHES